MAAAILLEQAGQSFFPYSRRLEGARGRLGAWLLRCKGRKSRGGGAEPEPQLRNKPGSAAVLDGLVRQQFRAENGMYSVWPYWK